MGLLLHSSAVREEQRAKISGRGQDWSVGCISLLRHSNNGDLLVQAAEAGMRIALLPTFVVEGALCDGRLAAVMCDWQAPPISINAVYNATQESTSERYVPPGWWPKPFVIPVRERYRY